MPIDQRRKVLQRCDEAPGAEWCYAARPARKRQPVQLVQFAVGTRVDVPTNSTVILTQRFRGRVINAFIQQQSGGAAKGWREASHDLRDRLALLCGKDAAGEPLTGHEHAVFFLHFDKNTPTRLCVWRDKPLDSREQDAILAAADKPLPLRHEYRKGNRIDPCTVTLTPLDPLVPSPPAISAQPTQIWTTMTPYVPPRHTLDRRGKPKTGDSIEEQIIHELTQRAIDTDGLRVGTTNGCWTKVHVTGRQRDSGIINADKRAYRITLHFAQPIHGPLYLGASNHFGLGLFVPAD